MGCRPQAPPTSPVDGHDGRVDTTSQLLGSLLSRRRGVFAQDGVGDSRASRDPPAWIDSWSTASRGEVGDRRPYGRVWNSSFTERRHRQRFQGIAAVGRRRPRARGHSDRHAAGVLDLERVPSSSSPIAVRDGDGCINAHAAPLLSAATNGPARLPGPPGFTCPPRGALAILATSLVVRASAALAVCSRDFGGNQAESCTSRRRHHLKRRSSTAETVSRTSGQPTRHEGDSRNDPGQHARPLAA